MTFARLGDATSAGAVVDVAVVTGGASGIGAATVRAFAGHGVRTVFSYFGGDTHDPREVVATVEEIGGECHAVEADVRSADSLERLFDSALSHFGRVDGVVANAGVLRATPIESMTEASWSSVVDVDLTGVVRTFRSAVTRMPHGGSLVAVSSTAGGVLGWANHSHYATAKAGLLGLVRSLAVELGPRGFRVNAVLPGVVPTPQSLDPVNSLGSEGMQAVAADVPLRRVGRPDEIGQVIRFLCSTDASYISGAEIRVDGGASIALRS